MIPICVLAVDESGPWVRELKETLEDLGGFEVITTSSPSWGMLCLARYRPDVLLLNPSSGRGSVEEWRRAIEVYRSSRSLGVLALGHKGSERDRRVLEDLADLGICERTDVGGIEAVLVRWAGEEEALSRAA